MRIIAISDQHGQLDTQIPPCDLLIVAGDLCPDFAMSERQRFWFYDEWLAWRMKQPAKECIVTWGNHDFCGEDLPTGITHLTRHAKDAATHIVIDDMIEIQGVKIWCSPWSNAFRTPSGWAFMIDHKKLAPLYEGIPDDVDIIVSHGPIKGYGDHCPPLGGALNTPRDDWQHVGSEELRDAVDRIEPKILICGHIHTARGIYNRGETTIYNVAAVDFYVKLRDEAYMEIDAHKVATEIKNK